MPKKSIQKAASGVFLLVVDLGCGYITSPGDSLQTVRTLDMERRRPLIAICATWRADQVLYGSCTLGMYCAYLCKILVLGVVVGSRNSAQYSGSIEFCVLL